MNMQPTNPSLTITSVCTGSLIARRPGETGRSPYKYLALQQNQMSVENGKKLHF